jgi:hypothetical protein
VRSRFDRRWRWLRRQSPRPVFLRSVSSIDLSKASGPFPIRIVTRCSIRSALSMRISLTFALDPKSKEASSQAGFLAFCHQDDC